MPIGWQWVFGAGDGRAKPPALRFRKPADAEEGSVWSGVGLIAHAVAAGVDDDGLGVVEQAIEQR